MYSSLPFPHELVPVREIPEDKIRIILERYFFVWSRHLTKDWYLAPFFVSPCARASEASFRGDRALGFSLGGRLRVTPQFLLSRVC